MAEFYSYLKGTLISFDSSAFLDIDLVVLVDVLERGSFNELLKCLEFTSLLQTFNFI
jgi:hypothetical protein